MELRGLLDNFKIGKSRLVEEHHNSVYNNLSSNNSYCTLSVTKVNDSLQLVGRPVHLTLDDTTTRIMKGLLQALSLDIRCSTGTAVVEYSKVIVHQCLVFSKDAKRVKRHRSYTVSFTDPSNPQQISYGCVQKFLVFHADPHVGLHVALIKPFEVGPCELIRQLNYPPEIECLRDLLSSDFVSVTCQQALTGIPIEHITLKCFDASSTSFSVITTCLREYDCR